MKNTITSLFLMVAIVMVVFFAACKTTNIATPAPNTATKPAVDTAMQGDKMKDASRQ